MGKNRPFRHGLANFGGRDAFVFSVIPFRQTGIEVEPLRDPRELRSLTSTLQGTRYGERKIPTGKDRSQFSGCTATIFRERDIGEGGMLTGFAPCGFCMTNQNNLISLRHTGD